MHRALLLVLPALLSCKTDVVLEERENLGPDASIQFPDDLSEFDENDSIEFRGLVADADGLEDIQAVTWTSNVDGELGTTTGAELSSDGITIAPTTLSEGTHTITLEVVDSEAASASDSITVLIDAAAQLPVVEILDPANLAEVELDAIVDLTGSVTDPNQDPDTLVVEWTVEPAAGGTAVALLSDPTTSIGVTLADWTPDTVGNFKIRLEATDDDGNTTPDEIVLLVVDPDSFDGDEDGYSPNQGDCNDDDASINPGADEACNTIDDDCNTIVDDKDLDSDAHIDDACTDYAGNLPVDDCDDGNINIYGNAPELADGLDNDCDGDPDDGLPSWDADGDCYCVTAPCSGSVNGSCASLLGGDCDDGDALRSPGNFEDTCTNLDEDCDDQTPDAPDVDNDGVTICDTVPDCDDNDRDNYPGNVEACDSQDNDCDVTVDEDITNRDYWPDNDNDGYGDPNQTPMNQCSAPNGYVPDNTDCDDSNTGGDINPGESETTCNNINDDCDSGTPDAPDVDGDQVTVCDGDCDDDDPANYPGNTEDCDGFDNNCIDGPDDTLTFVDYWPDVDGDGEGNSLVSPINACESPSTGAEDRWVTNGFDCADGDPDRFTTNTEICNGLDEDCDNVPDNDLLFEDWWPDADGDGEGDDTAVAVNACETPSQGVLDPWVRNNDDCDDDDEFNYLANTETCDGEDNDCDGQPDNDLTFYDWYPDTDGDTYGDGNSTPVNYCANPSSGPTDRWVQDATDCDDSSNLASPAITVETTCDDLDNDCNASTLDKPDMDTDGVDMCSDCDDDDINNFPGNDEECDGLDNNCDTNADEGLTFTTYYEDFDRDTYGNVNSTRSECADPGAGWVTSPSTDCLDTEFTMNPGYAEQCDGLNNDCDADGTDEQCPASLTVEPAVAASPQYGGGGGSAFDDECGANQVMVGINVRAADRMDRVQAVCAQLSLVESTGSVPYTYTIDRGSTEYPLAANGGGGGTAYSWRCPGEEVVMGIFGRSGGEVDSLQLQCGTLSVSGSVPGSYATARTTGTTSPQWADNDGGSAFSYNCPSGQAVKWLWGRGGSRIDAIGVSCSVVTINQP